MHSCEGGCRSRKYCPNMPSFSSILLDEIYRSIDGNGENTGDFTAYRERTAKRQEAARTRTLQDEELSDFGRPCFVEKWMGKGGKERGVGKGRRPLLAELESKSLQENDVLFFSSTSSSSDSSGALSSSDTEFFGSSTKQKVSCFTTTRPKPVGSEDHLIRSQSRAVKIYANLKKMKQPISPGGRLTSFINSLFSNANGKKSKGVDRNKGLQDVKSSKASSSSCSSASSSSCSRSCLSKYSPKSRERMRNGTQRTVRFHPVSVIVGEDSRPCGHKCTYDGDSSKYGRLAVAPKSWAELELSKRDRNRKIEEAAQIALKGYCNKRGDGLSMFGKINGDDDDDGLSDTSSDLFELDHLSLFGNSRFCEELPVYETTNLETNRPLIC